VHVLSTTGAGVGAAVTGAGVGSGAAGGGVQVTDPMSRTPALQEGCCPDSVKLAAQDKSQVEPLANKAPG